MSCAASSTRCRRGRGHFWVGIVYLWPIAHFCKGSLPITALRMFTWRIKHHYHIYHVGLSYAHNTFSKHFSCGAPRRVSELTKLEVGIVSRETTTNRPLSWRRCNWKWSLPENTGDPLGLFGRVFMNYRVRANISLLPSLRPATNITSIILTEFWLMFGG